jgi:hypothetical protein
MVSSQRAFANKTPSAPPELASDWRSEYELLIHKLEVIEQQFKLGNVDEPLPNDTCTFEETLDPVEQVVLKYQKQLLAEHPVTFYHFISILAECRQYFGRSTETTQLDLYLFAQELYRELPKDIPADDDAERTKLSSIIRVIVAGLEYLLTVGDFVTALSYGHKLLDFALKTQLETKSNLDAPLGVIYQFLARTLRARGSEEDCREAIDYFYKCSESYSEIALEPGVSSNEIIYARTRAAVSLALGAGFLFYNAKGNLIRAKDAIRPARLAFLRDSGKIGCRLYYHYFELLHSSILREEAGELNLITHEEPAQLEAEKIIAQAKLDQARKIIDTCDKELGNRPKYFIHVLFNSALVYLYQGPDHYECARKCVEQLFVECQSNPRWLANAFVLKSQLELRAGDVDTALADAIKAYSHAGNHLPVKIEALLARGQAQLARNKLTAARADVERALQLNEGVNLRLTALGNLLLVEMALEQKQPGKAYERLLQVGELMPSIRHGSLINHYRQLSAKLDHVQNDYLITSNTEVLHYKKFEKDLQRWLLEKALREDKNVTRVARRLQVTKKTIYMWLDRYKIKP